MGQQWVDATTIKGARAAGIACTVALSVLILASIWEPTVLFWPPPHPADERMLMALLLGMPLSLALAMRDPVRNAGVCAVIGLGCAFLAMSRVFSVAVGERSPDVGWLATVAFLAIAVALVVTYTRLRRPHPLIVRVVVAATALMPAVLYAYDWAVRTAYAGR